MTIKEVEQITGLTRSNIRFYEKENLICPVRNGSNGYREYSEDDVKNIKKIAYLRTLGISIEDIRKLSSKEAELYQIVEKQKQILGQQISYPYLPNEIPIQWSGEFVSTYAEKSNLFLFPLSCVVIRFALCPLIWKNLSALAIYSETVTNYLINYMCFIVFSVEVFTILYVYKIVKYVAVLLVVDTVILIGVLVVAGYKAYRKR